MFTLQIDLLAAAHVIVKHQEQKYVIQQVNWFFSLHHSFMQFTETVKPERYWHFSVMLRHLYHVSLLYWGDTALWKNAFHSGPPTRSMLAETVMVLKGVEGIQEGSVLLYGSEVREIIIWHLCDSSQILLLKNCLPLAHSRWAPQGTQRLLHKAEVKNAA